MSDTIQLIILDSSSSSDDDFVVLEETSTTSPFIVSKATDASYIAIPASITTTPIDTTTTTTTPTSTTTTPTDATTNNKASEGIKRKGDTLEKATTKKSNLEEIDIDDLDKKYADFISSDDDLFEPVKYIPTNTDLKKKMEQLRNKEIQTKRSLSSSTDLFNTSSYSNFRSNYREPRKIILSVQFSEYDGPIMFTIDKNDSFQALFEKLVEICIEKGILNATTEFIKLTMDAVPILPTQTPSDLDLENNDILKAVLDIPIDDENDEDDLMITDTNNSEPSIQIKVRIIIDGKDTKEIKKYKLKLKDPMDKIVKAIKNKLKYETPPIGAIDSITLFFDGEKIKPEKTPIFYDLEKNDLLDAAVKTK